MSSPDPWTDPNSPSSNILRVPDDIPLPSNILSILTESRKKSANPDMMSWKEVVCAGSDDEVLSKEEQKKPEESVEGEGGKENDVKTKRSNKSPGGLSPEDAKKLFEFLESVKK
ncbi:MAG: hypothetical protein Q9204_007194 [Flavoplaca sp. TL-2023a]